MPNSVAILLSLFISSLFTQPSAGDDPNPPNTLPPCAALSNVPEQLPVSRGHFYVKRNVSYMNTATLGPMPREALRCAVDVWEAFEADPVDMYPWRGHGARRGHGKAAAALGCGLGEMVPVPSTVPSAARGGLRARVFSFSPASGTPAAAQQRRRRPSPSSSSPSSSSKPSLLDQGTVGASRGCSTGRHGRHRGHRHRRRAARRRRHGGHRAGRLRAGLRRRRRPGRPYDLLFVSHVLRRRASASPSRSSAASPAPGGR